MKIRSVVAVMIAALALAAPAQAQLTGETLTGVPEVDWDCNPDRSGSATFDVTGVAEGPYPGTFEETGRFDFRSHVRNPAGGGFLISAISDFRARFSIDSVAGDVVGVKAKSYPQGSEPFGECPFFMLSEGDYDAIIRTEDGTFRDSGTSFVYMPTPTSFTESFTASTAFAPFTKHDCKDESNAAFVALAFPGGEKECKQFVKG